MSDTQDLAWARIQAVLSACQWRTWQWLQAHPDSTRNELDVGLSDGRPNPNFSRRLVELERMGLARRGAARPCRVTSYQAETWHAVVNPEPARVRRPPPERLRYLAALEEIVGVERRDLAGLCPLCQGVAHGAACPFQIARNALGRTANA